MTASINVHLRLDSPGREYVFALNERIRSLSRSTIILSSKSRAVPHITLLTGVPIGHNRGLKATYERLVSVASELIAATGLRSAHLKAPYVSLATRGYVLGEVVSEPSIEVLKK